MGYYEKPLETYSLIYAVTQNAVNRQIAWAHANLTDAQAWIEFGDAWKEDAQDGGLRARLAPPKLDFSFGETTQVRLTLGFDPRFRPSADQISSGPTDNKIDQPGPVQANIASIWSGSGRKPILLNFDCTDWLLSFDIDLNLAEVDPGSQDTPASLRSQLTAFDSQLMSVNRLFLDFTQGNRLVLVAEASFLPLPAWLDRTGNNEILSKVAISTSLGAKQLQGNEKSLFDLGYVITNKPQENRALFAPTGAVFSTKPYTDSAGNFTTDQIARGLSTLNYLLNTDDQPVRRDVETTGKFLYKNLVTQGDETIGKLIITSAEFERKVVGPIWEALMRGLRGFSEPHFAGGVWTTRKNEQQQPPLGQPWSFDYDLQVRNSHGDVDTYYDRRNFTLVQRNGSVAWRLDNDSRVDTGAVEFEGTGHIYLEMKFERYRDLGPFGESYEGKTWHSSESDVEFKARITFDPDTRKILVIPALPGGLMFARSNEREDNSNTGFQSWYNSGGPAGRMKQVLDQAETNITEAISSALAGELDALRLSVFFPMPGEVRYSGINLSENGDLEIDLEFVPNPVGINTNAEDANSGTSGNSSEPPFNLDESLIWGKYQRLPVENGWHAGAILSQWNSGGLLRWSNEAGVSWTLIPDYPNALLMTETDNPYYNEGRRSFDLVIKNGKLTGFIFGNEFYTKLDDPQEKG